MRARYEAEKMYFLAEKASRSAGIRPNLVNPAVSEQFLANYAKTLEFCYNMLDSLSASTYPVETSELTGIAFRAATRLSQLHYGNKEYATSANILQDLLTQTDVAGSARIATYLNLGRALQSAGKWDSASAVYGYSVDTFYPPLDPGENIVYNLFNLPARIARIYQNAGDTVLATDHTLQAEQYYKKLTRDFPNSPLEYAARNQLANLYERSGEWNKAIEQLEQLTDSTGKTSIAARIRITDFHAGPLGKRRLALREYDSLLGVLPDRDSLEYASIIFKKGLVLMDNGDHGSARNLFLDIKNQYSFYFYGNPSVQLTIAQSFEIQDNWDRAETEYEFLIENFAGSHQAMSTYLYLADKYSQKGRNLDSHRMMDRAEADFDRLAANQQGRPAEAIALSYKAELLGRQQDWDQAATLLVSIFERFSRSEIGCKSLINASAIYRDQLGNPIVADSLIGELKKKFTAVDETAEI